MNIDRVNSITINSETLVVAEDDSFISFDMSNVPAGKSVMLQPVDNVIFLDGTAPYTHEKKTTYIVDALTDPQTINIFFDTFESMTVKDQMKEFDANECTVNIYAVDGITIEHTAILDRRDKETNFFKVGTVWYYTEVGKGEVVAVASVHRASEDFTDGR